MLEVSLAAFAIIWYATATFTMFFICYTVSRDNIPLNVADQAFQETSTLFQILVVPGSFNDSSDGMQGWVQSNYVLRIMFALLMLPIALLIFVGLCTSDTIENGAIGALLLFGITIFLMVYCYRNWLYFKKRYLAIHASKLQSFDPQ